MEAGGEVKEEGNYNKEGILMALTFPVDTRQPHEIQELKPICEAVPGMADMVRYACYRFDPNCAEVRKSRTVAEKDAMAASLAGYVPTSDKSTILTQIATMVLRQINSLDWEIMCSLEIALDEAMQIVREQIKLTEGKDDILKAVELKQKVIAGLGKTEDMLLTRQQKIAAGDEMAHKLLNETARERKQKRNTLTGQMEDVPE